MTRRRGRSNRKDCLPAKSRFASGQFHAEKKLKHPPAAAVVVSQVTADFDDLLDGMNLTVETEDD